jgi:hypothetical protein
MNRIIGGNNTKTKTTGAAFLVKTVISTFQDGKFTQLLNCVVSDVPYTSDPAVINNRNSENNTTTNSTPTAGGATSQGSGYSLVQPVTSTSFKVPSLSTNVITSVYGSASVPSNLLDGTQRNLVNDDAALSVGAGTTQAGKVDETKMSVNQRLSALSQRVSAFFKPGTPPPARAPGSVPGGVTRINPSDIQPM